MSKIQGAAISSAATDFDLLSLPLTRFCMVLPSFCPGISMAL
jgi:hypothetical protein